MGAYPTMRATPTSAVTTLAIAVAGSQRPDVVEVTRSILQNVLEYYGPGCEVDAVEGQQQTFPGHVSGGRASHRQAQGLHNTDEQRNDDREQQDGQEHFPSTRVGSHRREYNSHCGEAHCAKQKHKCQLEPVGARIE